MSKKEIKFLSISQAIDEIIHDFNADSDQYDLFAKVYTYICGGKAVVGEKSQPPFDIPYGGIWYQPENSDEKEFYCQQDFVELLNQAFSSVNLDSQEIIQLYMMVMCVNAYISKDSGNETGIWVETEMEKFRCIQCGHCCLDLSGAFITTAHKSDLNRWEQEERFDILQYVAGIDLWVNPRTGEDVLRCPWLRKVNKQDKYICRIHDTKPKHCREYPKSKKHALRTGCPGFTASDRI